MWSRCPRSVCMMLFPPPTSNNPQLKYRPRKYLMLHPWQTVDQSKDSYSSCHLPYQSLGSHFFEEVQEGGKVSSLVLSRSVWSAPMRAGQVGKWCCPCRVPWWDGDWDDVWDGSLSLRREKEGSGLKISVLRIPSWKVKWAEILETSKAAWELQWIGCGACYREDWGWGDVWEES